MSWKETLHGDADALATSLAGALEAAVRRGLAARGSAVLALAGGGTPLPAYRALAQATLDWSSVILLATDERWVAHDHAARNERQLREAFSAAAGVRVVSLTAPEVATPPDAGAAQAALARLAKPFDAVLLGMGTDGHFASLFPGAPELRDGLRLDSRDDALVAHPDPLPPEAPFARVSLSASRLLRTDQLLLAVTGAAKREVLTRAQVDADACALPIAALLHAATAQVEIHWSP